MKHFKYDVVELIKAVRDRPVIWDKTLETYKDRIERKNAWEEIFRILDSTYEDMTLENRRMTGEMVINRWTNVRDTFMRSLKNQKNGARKYIFHDQMCYLLKVAGEHIHEEEPLNDSDDDPISYNMDIMLKQEQLDIGDDGTSSGFVKENRESRKTQRTERNFEESSPERETYTRKKRSKRRETEERRRKQPEEDSQSVDFVEMNEVNDPRVMNEDEAFFASLLPTIVKYSEDERLEFRIQVLAVMKTINDKRRQRWTEDSANDL